MTELLPLFLNLTGRPVLLVGGGPVATAKLRQLLAVGAHVHVVAPEISLEIEALAAEAERPFPGSDRGAKSPAPQLSHRPFTPADLDDVWLAVAAATPDANREVADAAEPRHLFVNAVDDPANATAFLSGVVRRDGVTVAISTSGHAPALTSLLREAIDGMLPRDLATWMWRARAERVAWRREGVPMDQRKPRLLQVLNEIYRSPEGLHHESDGEVEAAHGPALPHPDLAQGLPLPHLEVAQGFSPAVPWLNGPEDSWL